ncbi:MULTISPECIES: hypothetical protein [Caldimonas]|uniref:hypothetical protein n=1 Tax=Caldimonas TaxID=196013 RepID=UPI00036E90AD|nr:MULTISPECIES: hypothetical protein [Caldimonas]GIX22790.1 MAG: hypothetical protein KatS3mg122_0021 [Caldimonas sp.]
MLSKRARSRLRRRRSWLSRVWRPRATTAAWWAWTESALLPVIALGVAWRLNPSDPLALHAAFPWVWFGAWLAAVRYGAGYGLAGAALYAIVWWWQHGAPVAGVALFGPSGGHFPGEFFLGGTLMTLVLGEFGSAYRRSERLHQETARDLSVRLERTKRRLFIVKEALATLEQELVDRPLTLRDALLDFRQLCAQWQRTHPEADDAERIRLPQAVGFLQLLSQSCRVVESAIFVRDPAQPSGWHQAAVLGHELPELDDTHPLIATVLDNGHAAHIAQEALGDVDTSDWVYAAVLRSDEQGQVQALLVAHTMPFMAFEHTNLQRLQVLVDAYRDFVEREQGVGEQRETWPEAPIELQQEWTALVRLSRRARLHSHAVLWALPKDLPADARARMEQAQPVESESWQLTGPTGRVAWVTVLPLSSAATLDAYLRQAREVLQTALAGEFEPSIYDIQAAHSFAQLRDEVRRHLHTTA